MAPASTIHMDTRVIAPVRCINAVGYFGFRTVRWSDFHNDAIGFVDVKRHGSIRDGTGRTSHHILHRLVTHGESHIQLTGSNALCRQCIYTGWLRRSAFITNGHHRDCAVAHTITWASLRHNHLGFAVHRTNRLIELCDLLIGEHMAICRIRLLRHGCCYGGLGRRPTAGRPIEQQHRKQRRHRKAAHGCCLACNQFSQ